MVASKEMGSSNFSYDIDDVQRMKMISFHLDIRLTYLRRNFRHQLKPHTGKAPRGLGVILLVREMKSIMRMVMIWILI